MPVLKARIGGAWVDVGGGGGGTDEVWVGSADPIATVPTAELWYDTDAVAPLSDDMRWSTAWGKVAIGTFAFTDAASLVTNTPLTNTLTFVPLLGRRYRVVMRLRAVLASANTYAGVPLVIDGLLQNDYSYRQILGGAGTGYNAVDAEYAITGDGVSHAYRIDWVCPGTTNGYAGLFYIEDVGPVTGSAAIPAVAVTPWVALPFAAGWGNFGGGYQTCQYRKHGDMVQLRGLAATTTTTAATTMGTLPAGFRPPADVLTIAKSAWNTSGGQRMEVFTSGVVSADAPPASANSWCSLAGIQFSVST